MKRIATYFSMILIISSLSLLFPQEDVSLDYKIGPKDLLEISVFGLDELNRTVRVQGNGKITLPLLGEVDVDGLTLANLEKKLSQLLEVKYLQNPQVTVFIREYQSKRVSVLGAVQNPGPYELLGRQTLMQIISEAGGLTSEAGDEIIIMRQLDGSNGESLRIPTDDLFLKGDSRMNIALLPNDIINIPLDRIVTVYVFGKVNNPGVLEIKESNMPTIIQAIAQAGGFAERASKKKVLIKRIDESGKEIKIEVNVKAIMSGKKKDFQLKENDVVYVPQRAF